MRQAGTVAYMSDSEARFTPSRTTPEKAMLAVSEARAILAETEGIGEADHVSMLTRRTHEVLPADGCVFCEAGSALAESLAAILPVLDALEAQARQ